MYSNDKNITFTLSQLQMYDECPQKYKFYYADKIPYFEKPDTYNASNIGNNIHNLINYYLKGFDTTKLKTALSSDELTMWANFEKNEILNYQYLKSEFSFNVRFSHIWFNGRIDALFKNAEEYIIADWKTGENFKSENANFQTAFYILCFYEILKSKNKILSPEKLSLQYINLSTNEISIIKNDQAKLQQYKNLILKTAQKICIDSAFTPLKSTKCKLCKYSNICQQD